jgi:hypothetical protein
MVTSRLGFALLVACWALPVAALDRGGAIEAAKREMKATCTTDTPCKFSAHTEGGRWHVRVDFTKGNSPHAILILNQAGKVVGRIDGK